MEQVVEKNQTSFVDIRQLSDAIKFELKENTVVIFKTEREKCSELGRNLRQLQRELSHYRISFLACPKDIDIVVIPKGTSPGKINDQTPSTPQTEN